MNPDVKAKWVEALRSGEYEQGIGNLTGIAPDGKTSYCCLGVLCDLAMKSEGVNIRTNILMGSSGHGFMAYETSSNYLPYEVREWAGLQSHNPVVRGRTLARLNDEERLTFSQIADLIEEHL